jgi:hypothetical protein
MQLLRDTVGGQAVTIGWIALAVGAVVAAGAFLVARSANRQRDDAHPVLVESRPRSGNDFRQLRTSLTVVTVAMTFVVIGFVLDVAGWDSYFDGSDPNPTGTGLPVPTWDDPGYPPDFDGSTSDAPGEPWIPLIEDELVLLDNSGAASQGCPVDNYDLDYVDPIGGIWVESGEDPLFPEDSDLVWHPCQLTVSSSMFLGSGANPYLVLFGPDSPPDAQTCFESVNTDQGEIGWYIDPAAPDDIGIVVGATICMETTAGRIGLLEVVEIRPAQGEADDAWIILKVSTWE